ncbi:mCG1042922, partial [Mus musculus]
LPLHFSVNDIWHPINIVIMLLIVSHLEIVHILPLHAYNLLMW